jgi:hypothetical protein
MQENTENNDSIPQPTFQDRDFEEVEGGYYDHQGYYITPNGSFWDENLVYYNRDGFDKYGGTFDEYGTYFPGQGWNEDFGCYDAELGNQSLTNYETLQNALQETIKQELLDEYHYYQKFFDSEENPKDICNLEIPEKDELPLKNEYGGYSTQITANKLENLETNTLTPSKKVDTISIGKASKSPIRKENYN